MTLDCIVKLAGLRAPPVQRSVVQEGSCFKEISGLFEEYLKQVGSKDWDGSYLLAEGIVRGWDFSDQSVIDAFIISHQDDAVVTDWKTGVFISALYNCLKQDVIVYDHNLPIDHLGFRLSQSKRLIVNGTAGDGCGLGSSGLVLVSGSVGKYCGWLSSGLVLVNGSAGNGCGSRSSGLVLVSGTAGDYCGWRSSGFVVECKDHAIKGWGHALNRFTIPYSKLVKNPSLDLYMHSLINQFTNLSNENKLEITDVESVKKEIRFRSHPFLYGLYSLGSSIIEKLSGVYKSIRSKQCP